MFNHYQIGLRITPSFLSNLNVSEQTSQSARVCRLIEIAHEELFLAGPVRHEPRKTHHAYLTQRQSVQLADIRSEHLGGGPLPQILEQLLVRAFARRPELVKLAPEQGA